MGLTALSGPFLAFGITQGSTGQVQDYNDQRGPSVFDLGYAIADPRYQFTYQPGSPVTAGVRVFAGGIARVNYVPAATGSSALAVSSATTPVAGTALTLATPSSALGTYATTIVAPEDGTTTGTLIAIDSTAAYVAFGESGTIQAWNPAAGTGRRITLTPAGNSSLDGGTWSIAGRDMYGFKVTESIPVSSQAMTSNKTFKYISSILAATTIGSTGVGVGFNSALGLPLVASFNSDDTQCRVNATSTATANPAQSNVALVLAATATATSTTGDVRGVWVSSVAFNGTARAQIGQRITEAMISAITASDTSAMFGVAQYSSV